LIVNKETNEEDHLNETNDGETSDLPQAEAAEKTEAPQVVADSVKPVV